MCGRYRLSRRKRIIEEHFDSVSGEERLDTALQRRLHSTSLHHPAASERAESCASLVRWGLIPSWAKDMSGAAGMINARSEAAACQHCRSQEHVILTTGAPVE